MGGLAARVLGQAGLVPGSAGTSLVLGSLVSWEPAWRLGQWELVWPKGKYRA